MMMQLNVCKCEGIFFFSADALTWAQVSQYYGDIVQAWFSVIVLIYLILLVNILIYVHLETKKNSGCHNVFVLKDVSTLLCPGNTALFQRGIATVFKRTTNRETGRRSSEHCPEKRRRQVEPLNYHIYKFGRFFSQYYSYLFSLFVLVNGYIPIKKYILPHTEEEEKIGGGREYKQLCNTLATIVLCKFY